MFFDATDFMTFVFQALTKFVYGVLINDRSLNIHTQTTETQEQFWTQIWSFYKSQY